MSAWILSIVGVCFIGVIFDVIVPEGKTNGFIKSMFAIFLLFVVVSPLPKLFNKTIDISTSGGIEIDNNFIYNINKAKIESLENDIENMLEKKGFSNVNVSISANLYESELTVLKVYVNIKNLVILNGNENIDKYKGISEVVLEYLNVSKEDIVFYDN